MKKIIIELKTVLKKYIKKVVLYIMLLSVLYSMFTILVISDKVEYTKEQLHLSANLINHKEDLGYLCNVTNCTNILISTPNINTFNKYTPNTNNNQIIEETFIELQKNIFFSKDFTYYIKLDNKYINVNISNIIYKYIILYLIVLFSLVPLFIGILYQSVKEEEKNNITTLLNNETILANKSMILLTENIHHELNTPMEIIENKVYKIKDIMLPIIDNKEKIEILSSEDKEDLHYDFQLISSAAEQVYAVLSRMKGLKHIRHSNGNKSIKDSLSTALQMITVTSSNFEAKVDDSLDNYRLHGKSIKNGDILNIALNHFKNSLEAGATKLIILLEAFDNKYIYLRLLDNGNGIPKEKQKNIFNADFSTKKNEDGIRGNGLYLNKSILKSSGGDVKLIESSKYGTTFELKIPAEKKPLS